MASNTQDWPVVMNLVSHMIESSYFDPLRRPALILAIVLNVLAFGLFKYLNSPWRKLPPGPVGYPIIGSAHRFFDSSWLLEECPKLGEVVYLNVAGQPAILLNTQKAATALLDRRSTNYSGRPRMIVANELMCDGKFLILEPFNDCLRRKRRAIHEGFNKSASMSFHGTLAEDAVRLAVSLEHDSKAFRKYYYTFSCSVVLAVTYDRPLHGRPEDDTLLSRIEAFAARAKETTAPGAHYVELLPWMKHLPEWMAKWKRDALITHRETTSFFLELMEDVETRMKQGLARSCLMSTMIQEQDRSQLSRDEIAWAAGFMYLAGSDTSATMLQWWTLAMVAFPDVQKHAQAELDAVVGRGRLPSFADRAYLPYTVASLREVLRWRTGLPLGVPHMSEADDFYEGMFIPKGSIILGNIMPCNRDVEIYGADAHIFKPERHLDELGQLAPAPLSTKDHGHVSFGFGRRVCVGHVAADALFIAIATMLWAYTFEKERGVEGREMEVDAEGYDVAGFILTPKHFECAIKPRFPDAIAILAAEKERQA